MTRSAKAGVLFPVGRIDRYLRRDTHHYRIGSGAPIYMAAVIEYLTGECPPSSRLTLSDTRLFTPVNTPISACIDVVMNSTIYL